MYATLESQGLTGVGFIQIQGGSRDGLALLQNGDSRPPVIPSRASQLEKGFQSAPAIADPLVVLSARLQGFLSDEISHAVQANLETKQNVLPMHRRRAVEEETGS